MKLQGFSRHSLCAHSSRLSRGSRVVAHSYQPTIITVQPSETDIYPPFFEAYVRLCDIPSFAPKIDARECMQTLVLPPYEIQMSVLQDVLEMETHFPPLEQVRPYLMYYLLEKDIEKVNALLQSFQLYLMSLDQLQDLILEALHS